MKKLIILLILFILFYSSGLARGPRFGTSVGAGGSFYTPAAGNGGAATNLELIGGGNVDLIGGGTLELLE